MISSADLIEEVRTVVRETLTAGHEVPCRWLTQQIIDNHRAIDGADAEWYTLRGYESVTAAVRHVMNQQKQKEDEEEDETQGYLPGFKRIQRAYTIKRNGDRVWVPTEQMTVSEKRAKGDEKMRMSEGNREHAEELYRLADMEEEAAERPTA